MLLELLLLVFSASTPCSSWLVRHRRCSLGWVLHTAKRPIAIGNRAFLEA